VQNNLRNPETVDTEGKAVPEVGNGKVECIEQLDNQGHHSVPYRRIFFK
jgi:hypothetical protein